MVVELQPVGDHTAGVLQRFKTVTMHALLYERANYALDHAALLRPCGVMKSWRSL